MIASHPRPTKKRDFPVEHIRRHLAPGPIVLVSSHWRGRHNVMTMGWHPVMEFSPSLIGCVISSANHSHDMIRRSRECVINLPTNALTDIVVRIGNCSGAGGDKFGARRRQLCRGGGGDQSTGLVQDGHAVRFRVHSVMP